MSSEIFGKKYKYIIDTSYGINQDGFIAIGTESIVYKGLKTKHDGGMQFSCVLKFKPKFVNIDGEIIDRLTIFKTEEWAIFEELRECRSIVRIDDVVEDMGDFSVPCDLVHGGAITSDKFFCVIEEYIDGWSLEEYCLEEFWKLRKVESLENNLKHVVNYHDFSPMEKLAIQHSYNYDNILKYQNQIVLFMLNLCDILEFVTERKNILHLDIKPENVMVTRHGKELVLIDFGRSKKITRANRFVNANLKSVHYGKTETVNKMFQYGSLGYAAPECYADAAEGSMFPFSCEFEKGKMSIESDIFSFGATFWECLNVFELVTKNKQFTVDPHDFYRDNFLNDETYHIRDLSCTSVYYHKRMENIIRKCTRPRTAHYLDADNERFYHSYKELRRDIEELQDSVPTIVREENVKAKNAFQLSGRMLALFAVFAIIYGIYRLLAFSIAEDKWEDLVASYNETQFYKLEEIAKDMITTAPPNQLGVTYDKVVKFTYAEDDISEYEVALLVELLQKVSDEKLLPQRVDEIVQHTNSRKYREASTEIVKLGRVEQSVGYELTEAIYNAEVAKKDIPAAYEVLRNHRNKEEYQYAVVKLKNVLDNDEYIEQIAVATGQTSQEIKRYFKGIKLEETDIE